MPRKGRRSRCFSIAVVKLQRKLIRRQRGTRSRLALSLFLSLFHSLPCPFPSSSSHPRTHVYTCIMYANKCAFTRARQRARTPQRDYSRKYLRLCMYNIHVYGAVHSIMLSGETRLSRILKGFNNIWKLLPKSRRSSSSLRYVLGATLGIRPIHLLSLRRTPKVWGVCGYRERNGNMGGRGG